MTSTHGARREESVRVSLGELLELEERRITEEAARTRAIEHERALAEQRARDEEAAREKLRADERAREEARANEERVRRSRDDEARAQAMQTRAVEEARAYAEHKARSEEREKQREKERAHEILLAHSKSGAEVARVRSSALVGAAVGAFAALAVCGAVYAGALAPRAAKEASLAIADSESRAQSERAGLEHQLADERAKSSSLAAKLEAAEDNVASLRADIERAKNHGALTVPHNYPPRAPDAKGPTTPCMGDEDPLCGTIRRAK